MDDGQPDNPPITEPTLSPHGLVFLVDAFYDGDPFLSFLCRGNEVIENYNSMTTILSICRRKPRPFNSRHLS